MDEQVVNRKILSLKRSLERIEQTLPSSAADLKSNIDAQDIIALNLQRAVQLCVDIAVMKLAILDEPVPDTMADAFRALAVHGDISAEIADSMVAAVGFRNLSVHQYDQVDWDIGYAICTKHLGYLRLFVSSVWFDL